MWKRGARSATGLLRVAGFLELSLAAHGAPGQYDGADESAEQDDGRQLEGQEVRPQKGVSQKGRRRRLRPRGLDPGRRRRDLPEDQEDEEDERRGEEDAARGVRLLLLLDPARQ